MKPDNAIKILTVVGTRPNFMKAAPIVAAIQQHNERTTKSLYRDAAAKTRSHVKHVLVHTGQHYDETMSDKFFTDLNIPKPDVNLGVGAGSHAAQTAEIMKRFEDVLLKEKPDLLVVVGDVNSTMASALVASKISFDTHGTRPLIAHVEAGLRSFDRCMPEEVNRIVTDHLADLLFVTEESGLRNLHNEGIPDDKIFLVGNTMIDSLLAFKLKAQNSKILDKLALRTRNGGPGTSKGITRYALLTLHRPSNVDDQKAFQNILEALDDLASTCPIIFSAHPRTKKRIAEFQLERFFGDENHSNATISHHMSADGRIHLIDPLGYLDFLCIMQHAAIVVTDSGGIQEETTCLGVPCVTVRENTERPVTIEVGTNILAGVSKEGIRQSIQRQLQSRSTCSVPDKWDGKTAVRILDALILAVQKKRSPFIGVPISVS